MNQSYHFKSFVISLFFPFIDPPESHPSVTQKVPYVYFGKGAMQPLRNVLKKILMNRNLLQTSTK